MIDLNYLDGKTLALILWGNNKEGKSDIQVCFGTARKKGREILFDRAPSKNSFYLDQDLVSQIKLPDGSLQQLMKGAQFVLSLSVTSVDDEEDDIETLIRPKKRA
ncbi:MAG: hypothetical protein H7326_05430 [Bdellovibrionaceae bacterium]|nr:hypothetical protein [Pseudobdellovibrionaceae bacterium]